MILLSRFLRLGLFVFSLYVLSGIIPISIKQFQSGGACPLIGPIPACYIVSVAYTAMGVAAILWTKKLVWLFILGALPVIGLALSGTTLELFGHPTCPRSESGLPLCYLSLVVGLMMAIVFLIVLKIEKSQSHASACFKLSKHNFIFFWS